MTKQPTSSHASQPAERIRLLGDPELRRVAPAVHDFGDAGVADDARRLHATLAEFRRTHGFGRGIAAPQIGIHRRMIAISIGAGPQLIVNPEVTWASDERFTMWDDCMSFPDLLVRVERHRSISLRFRDQRGALQEWDRLDIATSELLQHEIDHLDGILALDRAKGHDAIILRETFDLMRDRFINQVDYVIGG